VYRTTGSNARRMSRSAALDEISAVKVEHLPGGRADAEGDLDVERGQDEDGHCIDGHGDVVRIVVEEMAEELGRGPDRRPRHERRPRPARHAEGAAADRQREDAEGEVDAAFRNPARRAAVREDDDPVDHVVDAGGDREQSYESDGDRPTARVSRGSRGLGWGV